LRGPGLRHALALGLLVAALIATRPAQADPGAWFGAAPCGPDVQLLPIIGSGALLEVHYRSGEPAHEVLLEVDRDGHWRVPLEEWRLWTARPPPRVDRDDNGEPVVPLIPGLLLAFRYDGCSSEFWVDADPQRLDARDLNRPRSGPVTPAGVGMFANIDAQYGGLLGSGQASSVVDLGAFLPGASHRNGFFVDNRRLRRLDYVWLVDDADEATRLRLGDGITHAAEWEAPLRFGGLQWGRDFSLQPDRITFPLPSVAGSAALASTAQLYINGVQQGSQQLQPGQFRFDRVPALTGAGELSVALRDALGREQTIVQPFYASPRLLTAGLSANSYEAGFLRADYTGPNDRYTLPFAAMTLRQGLSNDLTATLRASTAGRRQRAGGEGDCLLTRFGVISVSAATSHTEAGVGAVATLGFEHVADRWSFTLRRRFATRDYGELGREPGSLHFSDAARLGFNVRPLGNLSAIYVSEQPWIGGGARFAGLAWTAQLVQRLQVYASWLHPLAGGSESIVAGLSLPFGLGSTAGVDWSNDGAHGGLRGYAQHSPGGPLGWSWLASADGRDGGLRQFDAALATERGSFGVGYDALANHGGPSALLRTGFALFDGRLFWTRPIQSSFAVVDTAPGKGVHVFRENQPVGVTDDYGKLLVPDLLPFQVNRLSIDDRDLPLALELGSASASITPPFGAGVPLRFKVGGQPASRMRLRDAAGAPIPAGAAMSLDSKRLELPVGYDGLVYLEIAPGRHRLEAIWPDGRCVSQLFVDERGSRAGVCEALPR
jgi:outer membrane usher protein